mgnify:CR=1 FL=1
MKRNNLSKPKSVHTKPTQSADTIGSPVADKGDAEGSNSTPKSAGSSGSKKSAKHWNQSPTKKSIDMNNKYSDGGPGNKKFTKDIADVAGTKLPRVRHRTELRLERDLTSPH